MVASKYAKKYINKYNKTKLIAKNLLQKKTTTKKKEKEQELRLMFGYQPT